MGAVAPFSQDAIPLSEFILCLSGHIFLEQVCPNAQKNTFTYVVLPPYWKVQSPPRSGISPRFFTYFHIKAAYVSVTFLWQA